MNEHLLIDGFNFARSSERHAPAKERCPDIKAMVYAFETYAFKKNVKTTIVFDGVRFEGVFNSSGAVEVLLSKQPDTADDVIRRVMKEVPPRERLSWILVSDDNALRDSARALGLRVRSTQDMAAEMNLSAKREQKAGEMKKPEPFNNPFFYKL